MKHPVSDAQQSLEVDALFNDKFKETTLIDYDFNCPASGQKSKNHNLHLCRIRIEVGSEIKHCRKCHIAKDNGLEMPSRPQRLEVNSHGDIVSDLDSNGNRVCRRCRENKILPNHSYCPSCAKINNKEACAASRIKKRHRRDCECGERLEFRRRLCDKCREKKRAVFDDERKRVSREKKLAKLANGG